MRETLPSRQPDVRWSPQGYKPLDRELGNSRECFTLSLVAWGLGRDEATFELKSRTTNTRAGAPLLLAAAFHLERLPVRKCCHLRKASISFLLVHLTLRSLQVVHPALGVVARRRL